MTVARLFLVGNTAVTYIFLPVSARLRRERDFETLRQIYVTSTRWVLLLAVPMFVLLFFVPGPAMTFVFGGGYASAKLALQILVLASFVSVVFGPANAALAGMGQSRSSLNATIVSAIVNVALSFTLIPIWGLIGAAIAWSVARLVYPGLCLVRLWTLYKVNPFTRTVVPPVVVATLVVGPVFMFVLHHPPLIWLPALFLVALAVYWAAILAMRAVEPMDLIALRAAQRRVGLRLPRLDRFLERFVAGPPTAPGPPAV
jgi:O-antigen/teichoic acid export membrane protein